MIKEIRMLDLHNNYIRMAVPFANLPDYMKEKATEFMKDNGYSSYMDEVVNGCIEIEDYNFTDKNGNIELVYFFEEYETLAVAGKNTEIGNVLYDFMSEYKDQINAIAKETENIDYGDGEFMEFESVKKLNSLLSGKSIDKSQIICMSVDSTSFSIHDDMDCASVSHFLKVTPAFTALLDKTGMEAEYKARYGKEIDLEKECEINLCFVHNIYNWEEDTIPNDYVQAFLYTDNKNLESVIYDIYGKFCINLPLSDETLSYIRKEVIKTIDDYAKMHPDCFNWDEYIKGCEKEIAFELSNEMER